MFVAKKLTIVYHPAQDRLRMAVEDENGRRMALWLTARLTRRLAEHLLSQVVPPPPREQPQASSSSLEQPASQGVLQSWEQDLALRSKVASSAVIVDQQTPQALAESVNVRLHAQGVFLTFHWGQDQAKMRLEMNMTQLRQWLDLICRLTFRAEWLVDYWPAWIRRASGQSMVEMKKTTLDKLALH